MTSFTVRLAYVVGNMVRVATHESTAPTSKQACLEALETVFSVIDDAEARVLSLMVYLPRELHAEATRFAS